MGFDFNKDFDFDSGLNEAPENVFSSICKQISEATLGMVNGNLKEYEGPIESYMETPTIEAITLDLNQFVEKDIQNDLGEVKGEISIKYEFYLTASQLKNYKYRILFLEYGINGYPVEVVLEQGIADEINAEENSDYIYEIKDKEGLECFAYQVINSKKIQTIIQELITLSQRKLEFNKKT